MESLIVSLRIAVASLLVCVAGYTLVVLGFAQVLTPDTANGSLIHRADGTIIGSRLIAQKFEQPRYFWPRPSAPDYNASGAAGSNKSPTSSDLVARATETVERYGATAEKPLPADLAAASGGGLDPHISERAARYQADRVATARGLTRAQVDGLITQHAVSPGGPLTVDRVVNVLELNLALDQIAAPVVSANTHQR
jgi:K+-transporting ATPase ATPase C chain